MRPHVSHNMILRELMAAQASNPGLLQFGSLLSARQYLRAYRLVQKYLPAGGDVLDWGAGNGHFSYFLLRQGYQTSGFDYFGLPPICEPFTPDRYTYRTMSQDEPVRLPFESKSFDGVVSIGVLEHVREHGGDERASLGEIARVLRTDGIFICFHLPNRYSWIEFMLRRLKRWSHQYRYTAADIRALCQGADLRLIEMHRYALLPRNIWWRAFKRMPGKPERMAGAYDRLDAVAGALLSPICQNYLFVAKRSQP